jgi:outer membrane protein assembly factor BamD (BamD/ComL family)
MIRDRHALCLALALAVLGSSACAAKKPVKKAESSVSAADRKAAEELYIKGVYAYAEGKTAEAISAWQAALKRDPKHAKARQSLAEAHAKQEAVKKLK